MPARADGTVRVDHSDPLGIVISFEVMRRFFAILAVGVGLAVAFAVVLLIASHVSTEASALRRRIEASLSGRELMYAFVVATTATLGSLYLSEIVHLEPCKFCWFQRIAMYPLALILGIAASRKDQTVRVYAAPMAVIGGSMSAYHYLIQQFPELSSGACSTTVPCTAAYIWEFGFMSIPLMALIAFSMILVLLAVARSNERAADHSHTDAEVLS